MQGNFRKMECDTATLRQLWGRKKYTGGSGDFTSEMQKRPLENQNWAPENPHRLQCKSLYNVADLVSGMWKLAPPPPPRFPFPCYRIYVAVMGSARSLLEGCHVHPVTATHILSLPCRPQNCEKMETSSIIFQKLPLVGFTGWLYMNVIAALANQTHEG